MRSIVSSSSSDQSHGRSRNHLYLNIYDLTPLNNYMYWFGVGIYHSGIEAYGVEYAFGAHDYPTSGVFEVEPKSCPGFLFRRSISLGTTDMSSSEFRQFIEHMAGSYNGDSYHLIAKNCNHFTNDVCMRLTRKCIPGWVNRLARIGVREVGELSQLEASNHHWKGLPASIDSSSCIVSSWKMPI